MKKDDAYDSDSCDEDYTGQASRTVNVIRLEL